MAPGNSMRIFRGIRHVEPLRLPLVNQKRTMLWFDPFARTGKDARGKGGEFSIWVSRGSRRSRFKSLISPYSHPLSITPGVFREHPHALCSSYSATTLTERRRKRDPTTVTRKSAPSFWRPSNRGSSKRNLALRQRCIPRRLTRSFDCV